MPELSHVVLVSRDVAATGVVLRALGLRQDSVRAPDGGAVAAFAIGRAALLVVPPGHGLVDGRDKPGVDHVAFGSADPAAAVTALGEPDAVQSDGPNGSRQVWLTRERMAGVRTCLCEKLTLPVQHQALVTRIDHIGVASDDNPAAIAAFCGRFGLVLESQQTDMEVAIAVESFTSDKYGVVYHTRPPQPVGGLRVAFITAGDCELEFLQNFDPNQGADVRHGAAGTTRQDQSAIARFVATRGAGLHHIAFNTPDIDGTLATLRREGIALIDTVGRPGSRRARIGFFHPSGAGGVLFHLVQRP